MLRMGHYPVNRRPPSTIQRRLLHAHMAAHHPRWYREKVQGSEFEVCSEYFSHSTCQTFWCLRWHVSTLVGASMKTRDSMQRQLQRGREERSRTRDGA